jgi:hypothetical protein
MGWSWRGERVTRGERRVRSSRCGGGVVLFVLLEIQFGRIMRGIIIGSQQKQMMRGGERTESRDP